MADEKFDEKEREKREEKAPEEKWQNDPLGAVVGAAILIWAGLVLLASNLGILDNLRSTVTDIPGLGMFGSVRTWGLILVGAGAIVLLGVLARLVLPAYRRPVGGSIIFGIVLIGLGLGNLVSWNLIWPLILIGIGFSILMGGLLRKR
jgi:hypothetical protein